MRSFGFGSKTPVDFPGESPGLLPSADTYRNSSTVMGTVPTGQGIAVTALQMLDVYTTLANDGVSRPPRLIAATIDGEGNRHEQRAPRGRRVVSSETAAKLRTMLAGVVADGTGTKGAVPGYTVAGKTGTAKKAPYDQGQYVASFVGLRAGRGTPVRRDRRRRRSGCGRDLRRRHRGTGLLADHAVRAPVGAGAAERGDHG